MPFIDGMREGHPTVVSLYVNVNPTSIEQHPDYGCVPCATAHKSGVRPVSSFKSTLTKPVSSSNLTTASCPPLAAHESGVCFASSSDSTLTLTMSNSSLTTAS